MTAPTDRSNPPIALQMRWAKRQIRSAVFICVIFGLLQTAYAFVDYINFGELFYPRVVCILMGFNGAIGIALGSRIVAVLALAFFGYYGLPNILSSFDLFPQNLAKSVVTIFFCYCAYRGVRGTFAYQRLKQTIRSQRDNPAE
ncbi:hypothetical protein Pse7367_1378 [Thalassoporum mexicanum PCC 7367]|uniref:hypothetical protein n=1 Tax=Thalassoporum mexicanum TaxID=3457544 RepID=UPI00029FA698|nr:hypothetical protein [Pseudanabaena sp. PCC 7367]AFY69670.1 hypothetical protein Pse7367_1378 [Pseudanabaena sp. PCC 7367]